MNTHTAAISDLGIDIRLMSLRDRDRIESLIEETTRDGDRENMANLPRCAADCHLNATHIWIAQHGGEVVAAISVTMGSDRTASIHGLHVTQRWAATILPILMIMTALEDGRSRGGINVHLDEDLSAAAAFAMVLDLAYCEPPFIQPAAMITNGQTVRHGPDGWGTPSLGRFLETGDGDHATGTFVAGRLSSASLG